MDAPSDDEEQQDQSSKGNKIESLNILGALFGSVGLQLNQGKENPLGNLQLKI